tara:strand:- start:348 stop:1046 length:699 start_codon:yes stop_codon:yes gene_type:complete
MIKLEDLEIISQTQNFYDNFNGFILSPDIKVFGKLLARTLLFNEVKNVPGDILEFGVFKGTGLLTFLKLKRYLCPNTVKKVVGFDFFETNDLLSNLSDQDKDAMTTLFKDRGFSHEESFKEYLNDSIKHFGFESHEFDLVKGDASKTVIEYLSSRPGLKISLLYLDMDLAKPTYDVLCETWDRVSKGGIVVFDEYAYQQWSESQGVDKFFEDKDVEIRSLNYMAPTACVVKK